MKYLVVPGWATQASINHMYMFTKEATQHSVLLPFLHVIPASISYIILIVKIKWKWKKLHGTKNFEHNSILPCTWCSNIMHIWCTKKYVSKIRYEHTHTHTNTDIYRRNINELCGSKSIYDIITWWWWWLRFCFLVFAWGILVA